MGRGQQIPTEARDSQTLPALDLQTQGFSTLWLPVPAVWKVWTGRVTHIIGNFVCFLNINLSIEDGVVS